MSAAALITALKLARSCTAGVAMAAGVRMTPVTNMATCACAVNMPMLTDDKLAYRRKVKVARI